MAKQPAHRASGNRPSTATLGVLLAGFLVALIVAGGRADATPQSRGMAAPLCKQKLALTAVYRTNGRIHFEGVADRSLRGKTVRIYEIKTDDLVVRTQVRPSGVWWVSAKTAGHRYTWLSKFVAEAGQAQSQWRRLGQAIGIRGRKPVPSTARTRVKVKVSGGLPERLVVGRQTGCSRDDVADKFELNTSRNGVATISLPRPTPGEPHAVYRVRSEDGWKISPPIVVKPFSG